MSQPTVLGGPAIFVFNGQSYYFEKDLTRDLKRELWDRVCSMFGLSSKHLASQMVLVAGIPVGALDSPAKCRPWTTSQIGTMLFTNTPGTIMRKDGKTETWANVAIVQVPQITCSPLKPFFTSTIVFACLGNSADVPTNAAYYNTLASAAFSDTTFDQTKLKSLRYLAALGSLASPYDAMESEDGFVFDCAGQINYKKVANWGVVNAMLVSLTESCRFKPVNSGDIDTYASVLELLQGTNALQPGDSIGAQNQDLVVSSGAVVLTLNSAGPMNGQTRYGLEPLRLGELGFFSTRTWTTGVPAEPLTIAFS